MNLFEDLFDDMSAWERLTFRVSMCVHLGEYPEDHGLTLEEIDYTCRWLWDNDNQCVNFWKRGDHIYPNGYNDFIRL